VSRLHRVPLLVAPHEARGLRGIPLIVSRDRKLHGFAGSGGSGVPVPDGSSTLLWDTRAGQAQDIQTAPDLASAQSQGACTLQASSVGGSGWVTDIGDGFATRGFYWTTQTGSQNNWMVFKNPHWHGRVLVVQRKFYCPAGFIHTNGHKMTVQTRELFNGNITTQEGRWTAIYNPAAGQGSTIFDDVTRGGMGYVTLTGTPTNGETLTFSPSVATATFDHTSSSGPAVYYTNVTGTPATGDTITGASSGCVFSGSTQVQALWGPNTGTITDARQHGGSFPGEIWAGDGSNGIVIDLNSSPYIGVGVRMTQRFTSASGADAADGAYECWMEGNGVTTQTLALSGLRTGTLGYGETQIGGPTWVTPPQVQTWYHYDFRMWGNP